MSVGSWDFLWPIVFVWPIVFRVAHCSLVKYQIALFEMICVCASLQFVGYEPIYIYIYGNTSHTAALAVVK